jgi:uncharacterized cupin superfamily protein
MDSPPTWFVVNIADAPTVSHPIAGTWTRFEDPHHPFQQVGVNLRVLGPGQPSTMYHAENAEETFLVISGHCVAIIGGQERALGPWDLLHVSPGVPHTFVGAGEGPCAILMIGARHPDLRSFYPYSPLAESYGASAPADTEDPAKAYEEWRHAGFLEIPLEWPPEALGDD